jgi:ABC-type nitrate/sulfonate/bicarbonate transport system permease component
MLIPFLWWSLTQYANIPDRFLPSLKSVFNAAIDLEPNLGIHTAATITRLLVGFIGGTVVGIALGIFFSRFPAMDTFFSPSIQALRAIPAAASVPFFLMWFGFSEVGRYLIVFLAVGLNVAVASSQILMGRSLAHRTFFASFRLSPGAFPLSYSLPRIVEDILPTLRFSLALSMFQNSWDRRWA